MVSLDIFPVNVGEKKGDLATGYSLAGGLPPSFLFYPLVVSGTEKAIPFDLYPTKRYYTGVAPNQTRGKKLGPFKSSRFTSAN